MPKNDTPPWISLDGVRHAPIEKLWPQVFLDLWSLESPVFYALAPNIVCITNI